MLALYMRYFSWTITLIINSSVFTLAFTASTQAHKLTQPANTLPPKSHLQTATMQLSLTTLFTTLLATTALAAPAPGNDVKSMSAQISWTIENMKRACDAADTSCAWIFSVNASGAKTACSFTVKKTGSTPASQAPNSAGSTCGPYRVTSGWSGQFGPGNGFTTLSVVNQVKKQIAWSAYTDKQLAGGKVVKPDQSYPVQTLA
jgi:hypothetical protein